MFTGNLLAVCFATLWGSPIFYCRNMIHKSFVVMSAVLLTVALLPPAAQAQDDAKAKAIEQYLMETFGAPGFKTPWYDSIKGISVQGNTVIASTNLVTGDAKASGVCFGVSDSAFSNQNRTLGLENVEVRGVNGTVLMRRIGLRGKCSRTADHLRRE